jgi:tetratricopeptide (TPR) repeat protein
MPHNRLSRRQLSQIHKEHPTAMLRRTLMVILPALLLWPLWPGGGEAQSVVQEREYDQCIAAAMRDPKIGFERAIAWNSLGGGVAARHCVAVALYGLRHFGEAALRLERLAQENKDAGLRVSLLGQAGNAWLMAGEFERANAALSAGLELAPDNIDLLIDRSLVLAEARNYWETVDDLNRALDIDPDNTDALIFRASAYRYLDSLDLAADDVNRALELRGDHVAAFLERGNIRRLQGDDAGARDDWLRAIKLAPNSPAAGAARRNLEKMDIKAE